MPPDRRDELTAQHSGRFSTVSAEDDAIRRRNLVDRLEGIQLDAERWQLAAWDAGELDEAHAWFKIAGIVALAVRHLEPRP